MIGELNSHDDPIVAQILSGLQSNPNLGFNHLQLPLRELVSRPDNVRGWIYRLIARFRGQRVSTAGLTRD
jgi:hypothetical protein